MYPDTPAPFPVRESGRRHPRVSRRGGARTAENCCQTSLHTAGPCRSSGPARRAPHNAAVSSSGSANRPAASGSSIDPGAHMIAAPDR